MDGRKGKPLIPVACRYVPFDRYFLTHGDPTWKVKHLKQRILARALSLPIDIARLDPDYVYVPPSTSVNRRKTGNATATNKRSREGFSGDDDEPWNAKKEGRGGEGTSMPTTGKRAPSPITFAGAEVDRDSEGEEYLSAEGSLKSGGVKEKDDVAASDSDSSSASDETRSDVAKPKTRRRGGSVSPIEFANPIVLRRQKSASMGAFLYEKGVEAGMVLPPPPKSEKAKGKQRAKDVESTAAGVDGSSSEEEGIGEGDGEGDDAEEVEAGYQVDDDEDSEDWSDDYDDEGLDAYHRSPKDMKEPKDVPPEKPETPPPGGRIVPGGDGSAVPPGSGGQPSIGAAGGSAAGGGVHFAPPSTPRQTGKTKKSKKGASIVVGPLTKIAKTVAGASSSHQPSHSMSSAGSQQHQRSQSQMVSYGPPPDPSDQILTLPFALVRFSTGQLLEDDLPLSWYDLRPYELLEVHFTLQPRQFEVSVRLGSILTRFVRGTPFNIGTSELPDREGDDRKKRAKAALGGDPLAVLAMALERERERERRREGAGGAGTTAADVPPRPEMFFHTETRELVPLPRDDLNAYVKPYWEGWARALRVMAPSRELYPPAYGQPVYTRAGPAKHAYSSSHVAGYGNAKYAGAEHPGAAMMGGGGGSGMVVWDPAMNTYGEEKEREIEVDMDSVRGARPMSPKAGRNPYHVLSQPVYGPAPGHGHNNRPAKVKHKLEWRERWVVIRDGSIYLYKSRGDGIPTHQLPLSALLALKDAEHLAQNQYIKERRDRAAYGDASTSGKATSPERARTSHAEERRRRHRRSTSTPRPSATGFAGGSHTSAVPGASGVPPLPHVRSVEVDQAERRRRVDESLEALSKWDDLGTSFNFGKKEKGKDKERGKTRDKDADHSKHKMWHSAGKIVEDAASDRGRRQRSVDLPRDREKIRQDQEWLAKEREREEAEKNPRTYIPTSRDDAEAAGMKIICAKFRHRGSGPPAASSKAKHWYTSTGPSLAGELAGEPDPSEYMRREDQAASSSYRPSSSQPVRAPNIQAPPSTVPGRQMGVQTTLAAGASLSNVARSDTLGASSATASSGKFGLSGLFGKDKDSDDPVARKEKEDRKREEKERKAKEKEFKRSEKDRKKDDRRRREEEEFRGITSSASIATAWIPTSQPTTSQSVSGRDLSDPSTTSAMHTIGSYSSTNATSVTLPTDDGPTTPKADQARPQLKISPVSTHHRNGDETLDDDDSDISFSSPVFAHSTESSDDDFSLARDRRGYRYGGYHAPAARKRSAPNVFAPHLVTDESKARPGPDSREEKAKEWEGSVKSGGRDSSAHRAPRRSSDNDRERGEWLVLDLGSDSAFTSLLRILHRQNPSIPSAFLPQSIAATLTPASQKVDSAIVQQESTPSSPIATPESGASPSPAKFSDLSGQDEADDSGHPEDLSAFVPHVSNRKAIATPALPYPEWRTALVKNSRFAGMREMDRPVHLAYTAWGREKHPPNSDGNEAQRHPKSDSIWARRTRNSFLRTRPADPKRSPEGQHENSTTPIVPTTLDAELVESDVRGSRKRMSLVSIKGERPSIERTEESADTLAFPPVSRADQPAPSLDDDAGMSGSDDGSDEGEEVILEVVSDEGFAYGRQDEEGAVAEALGWSSDESDEDESEFEWSAWYTDLPRQHALSTLAQEENDRQRSHVVRVAKEVPAPLSPIMFANPFVPDLIEPVMVYDRSRPNQQRPPTPPPKDPEEERLRALRNRRRGEPHATSIYQPIVHSHPNVSTPTLNLHHSSSSTSTLSQSRAPSRAPSSNQLSSQHSMSSYHPLSSPPSRDSLADRHRQAAGSQGWSPSLNTNAQQNPRMRLESNPTSPLSDAFPTTVGSSQGHELASQTFPRLHQRQHSRSVSGSDSIFESYAASRDQEMSLAASPPRPSGLHHSASMPSTRIASTSTVAPKTPHTVTFMPQHEEYGSEPFRPELSMEHMPDDRQTAEYRPAAPHASSPPSRHVVPQSPYPSSPSPRLTTEPYARGTTKPSNSVLKKRRSDLAKGKSPEQDMDAVPPLSPTTSEAGSTFSAMQASYPSRVPASNAFSTAPSTSTSTPLDKAKALVRRVRSGSSLGGHEFPTVVEEQIYWESEAARQPLEGPLASSSGANASSLPGEPSTNQPKKKKSAIDRFVRGFESSLDFMDGR